MIDFRTFESSINELDKEDVKKFLQQEKPSPIMEPQGLLNRTASVKIYDKIAIGYTSTVERGVFAVNYISKGECFEVAPIIVVPSNEVIGTALIDYAFKINDSQYAIAFGCASLYNHQNQPMAEWKLDPERKTISFFALRDISPSEEIYISYGKSYWNSRDISAKVSPKLNKK